jgi:hypothetical protein
MDVTSLDTLVIFVKPLECVVTIIANHFTAQLFQLIYRNGIPELVRFIQEHVIDKVILYGNKSGFGISSRLLIISQVIDSFDTQ